jgi:hypothetical protein
VGSLTDQHWFIVYQTTKRHKISPNELCRGVNAARSVKPNCFYVGFYWFDLIYSGNLKTTLFSLSVVITMLMVSIERWWV